MSKIPILHKLSRVRIKKKTMYNRYVLSNIPGLSFQRKPSSCNVIFTFLPCNSDYIDSDNQTIDKPLENNVNHVMLLQENAKALKPYQLKMLINDMFIRQ